MVEWIRNGQWLHAVLDKGYVASVHERSCAWALTNADGNVIRNEKGQDIEHAKTCVLMEWNRYCICPKGTRGVHLKACPQREKVWAEDQIEIDRYHAECKVRVEQERANSRAGVQRTERDCGDTWCDGCDVCSPTPDTFTCTACDGRGYIEVQPCSREKPHPGPCNGMLTPECHIKPAEHEIKTSMDQPPPVKNDRPALWPLVIEDTKKYPQFILDAVIKDMNERAEVGFKRYGTHLQPFNGRNALKDAYAEALDLAVYLKQDLTEREEQGRHTSAVGSLYERQLVTVFRLREMIYAADEGIA